MYSLHLRCRPGEVDDLVADLFENGTVGIREIDSGDATYLIAGFRCNDSRAELLQAFHPYSPEWHYEDPVDWVEYSKNQWQPRAIGSKFWLLPAWSQTLAPAGRITLRHNPGLACGTGEHPCTQLALMELERLYDRPMRILDVGTGSGILAIAARLLGHHQVVGLDTDEAALMAARENSELNQLSCAFAAGSSDCIGDDRSDLTMANINGSVLLAILQDLLRVTSDQGRLILTGFDESEVSFFSNMFADARVSELDGWCCVTVTPSSYVAPSLVSDQL